MRHPTCSVVIPTYNRARYLPAAIDSVLAQSLPVERIVVVDDGSSDDTPRVLEAYRDRCVTSRIDNAGAQTARNHGVRACDSEWIAFLDDDDFWRPDHLLDLMSLAAAAPELSMVFSDFDLLRGNEVEPRSKFQTAPDGWWDRVIAERRADGWLLSRDVAEASFRFHPWFPTAGAIRRDFFWSLGGFDPRMRGRRGEDGVFVANALLRGRTGAIPRASAVVRKHGDNRTNDQTAADKLRNLLSEIRNLREFKDTHPDHPALFAAIDAEVERRSVMAAHTAFETRDHATCAHVIDELPGHLIDRTLRVKRWVAALPDPLGHPLNRLLQFVRAGTRLSTD